MAAVPVMIQRGCWRLRVVAPAAQVAADRFAARFAPHSRWHRPDAERRLSELIVQPACLAFNVLVGELLWRDVEAVGLGNTPKSVAATDARRPVSRLTGNAAMRDHRKEPT